ncbi:hypothetical protein E2C01_008826 [Portunus trituberculatus]|uniref:Uncharacterized protein n=1 Tax=Portunus trituberculatus TaxID=210409 RepID=A0A5B7D3D9_PORTR|nr:hypothetical protein [Portunus trituberculatus]
MMVYKRLLHFFLTLDVRLFLKRKLRHKLLQPCRRRSREPLTASVLTNLSFMLSMYSKQVFAFVTIVRLREH